MRRDRKILVGLVVGAAVLALTLVMPQVEFRQAHADHGETQSLERMSAAFQNVAETITPSVVNISATRKVTGATGRYQNPLSNSPFRDFFGDDFFDRFFRRGEDQVQRGLGTGVLVDDNGHILTNNHVVDGADQLVVKLHDGRSFDARVVGTDSRTDLAVLRIDAVDLQPATFGDSDNLKVGQWVVAAGNPFGLNSSITTGIVSAKGRANIGLADYEDFIQTDAAINPGNSGGPLVNLAGEVVGINTAIVTKSGGYMGIGFAIPINMARSVMNSLIEDGRVVRGWLGALIQNLDEGLASSFNYDQTQGVLIGDVTPDGPAARAGLRAGDIILRFDGDHMENMSELRARVARTQPGTKVEIEIFRDGERESVEVEIGELEARVAVGEGSQPDATDLGMTVTTLTPQLAARIGQDESVRGVAVTDVDPFGAAARAGLQTNDVIVSVHGTDVESVSQFRAALKEHDLEDGVRFGVRRGSTRRFVFVRGPETS